MRPLILLFVTLTSAYHLWEVRLTLVGNVNDNTIFSLSQEGEFVEQFKAFSSQSELTIPSQRQLLLYTVNGMLDMYHIPVIFDYSVVANDIIMSNALRKWDDITAIRILLKLLDLIQMYIRDYFDFISVPADSTVTYSWMTTQRLLNIYGPQLIIVHHAENKRADILFLLRPFISHDTRILDVGADLGLVTVQFGELIPKGHLVACKSNLQSSAKTEYLTANMNNIQSRDIINFDVLYNMVLKSGAGNQITWGLVRINFGHFDEGERLKITELTFLLSLFNCNYQFLSPIVLLSVFGDAVPLQESLDALEIFRGILVEMCLYELIALPYHDDADFIAVPSRLSADYKETFRLFIFKEGNSSSRDKNFMGSVGDGDGGLDTVHLFPGNFYTKQPIMVYGTNAVGSNNIFEAITTRLRLPFVCTSYLDCGDAFTTRFMQSGARKVLMLTTSLSERGTSWQLYQYAHYAETLLGMKDQFFFMYPLDAPGHSVEMADLFKARFGEHRVYEIPRIDMLLANMDLLVQRGITHIYSITHGLMDICPEKSPNFAKVLYHCVFYALTPCGDVYARISSSVAVQDSHRESNLVPVVPHIVPWDASMATGENMRNELSIPSEAVVFCRHGGRDSFDIAFVHEVVIDVARQYPQDIYFVFMNTDSFTLEPLRNIIHLPATIEHETKLRFIRTCDAMLHARSNGETFGLAVAEFSILNRPVITSIMHTDNDDARNHIDLLKERGIYYSNSDTLKDILINFPQRRSEKPLHQNYSRSWSSYGQFNPKNVMRRFEEVFFNSAYTLSSDKKAQA